MSLVTPGAEPFLAPGHYLNKLGRGLLGDGMYQYQGLKLYGFRQEVFFHVFPKGLCNM